jgi:hypothetical protein
MQGGPEGLLVVTVMVTVFPMSADTGVYVNENGDVVEESGVNIPEPFFVNITLVALPPNVFPEIVTALVPHVLPLVELRKTAGGLIHPHDTTKVLPVFVHP